MFATVRRNSAAEEISAVGVSILFFVSSVLLLSVFLLPRAARAQEQVTTSQGVVLTKLHARLEKLIHVKRVKPGDTVTARLVTAATLPNGMELPKGTLLQGRVTEVRAKASSEAPSTLGLVFDHAEVAGKPPMPLAMALVSVAPALAEAGAAAPADNPMATADRQLGAIPDIAGSSGGRTTSEQMKAGVCYLPDIAIDRLAFVEPGTTLVSKKAEVYLDSGSRLLFLAK